MATATAERGAADERITVIRRHWKTPVMLAVFTALALLGFGLTVDAGVTSAFGLSLGGDAVQLEPIEVPSRLAVLVLGAGCLVAAVASFLLVRRRRRVPKVLPIGFAVCWLLAFLVWAIAGKDTLSFTGLLAGSVLLAVPLIFGAMSGVLCERSGVINIAIEGQLLAGAFCSALVASRAGNVYAGLVAAALAGALVSLLLGVFAIRYAVDQIVLGVVLNVLVIGLTSFLFSAFMEEPGDAAANNAPGRLSELPIPVLSEIPVLGPVLFRQTIIVYLMYVVVAVVHIALFRTRWGLRVRSVGEHPQAADTVGIKVNRLRFRTVLVAGLVAGLGGAFFTLGSVGAFGEEITAGKGFIALAAVIFGRWTPLGALAAALFFGFADNLQSVLGIIGTPIPSEVMLMAPYLATIFAVAGLVGRVRPPAADGQPYRKA